MNLIFIIASLGFLYWAVRIEIYLFFKCIDSFREVKKAYNELQEAKRKLFNA